jgi:hypothetical protein
MYVYDNYGMYSTSIEIFSRFSCDATKQLVQLISALLILVGFCHGTQSRIFPMPMFSNSFEINLLLMCLIGSRWLCA